MANFKLNYNETGDKYTVQVEGARLRFKNFSGRPTQFNKDGGIRTVCMDVDNEELYLKMKDDGWRFRTMKRPDGSGYADAFEEFDNGRVAVPYTELKLNFNSNRPPKVYLHQGEQDKKGTLIPESAIDELDYAYITSAKMVINPSYWESINGSGCKGYINILHAYIEPDPFMEDDDEDDEVPFA